MQRVLWSICLLAYASASFCQKPSIDTGVLGKWPYLNDLSAAISNDGHYVSYVIEKQPMDDHTLVIRSTDGSWEKEYAGASAGFFSEDSRRLVFQNGDTLYFQDLGADRSDYVSDVGSCKWPHGRKGEWLAYQLRGAGRELVLRNLLNGREQRFAGVTDYFFDRNGKVLVLITVDRMDSLPASSLKWVDLAQGKARTIWSAAGSGVKLSVSERDFDAAGGQLAFLVREKGTAVLWYYKADMDKAVSKVTGAAAGIDRGMSITGPLQFNVNGQWLFFRLQEPADTAKPGIGASEVEVWSYKDTLIQPEQRRQLNRGPRQFQAVVNVVGDRVIRVEREGERTGMTPEEVTGDVMVVVDYHNPFGFPVENWQDSSVQPSTYLLSLRDGSRKLLKERAGIESNLVNYTFSPQGRWLTYFDVGRSAYYSFDTQTGMVRNVSRNIPARLVVAEEHRRTVADFPVAPIAGWLGDSALLVYDQYDIWKVDPGGVRPPVNITNGYGRRQQIVLRLVKDRGVDSYYRGSSVLLTGLGAVNKYNGFYYKDLSVKGDPDPLTMGPYTYFHENSQIPSSYEFNDGMPPVKAREADAWIVKRQDAHAAPNFFFTRDFKGFTPLSNLEPQKRYNWLTDRLVSWKQPDGTPIQGILYLPEDFDPRRKYPVIFNYYEELSYRLYEFPYPQLIAANIDIPWFVSNGYLVFTPDIHYRIASQSGKPSGEWAYNSVISAARYLSGLPYVDNKRMAIQGHSFGGGETNYLITHSHLFAAAAEVAGVTDPLSAYLTLVPFLASFEHASAQGVMETSHSLYGANPWQRPELYRRNSAVLSADQVTTPLLIVHNSRDNQIQWRQGIELYMALRRLGKKVWMLQYDKEGHVISSPKDAMDHTLRLIQFFDHYLKGKPAPVWMTRGIPARLKGWTMGYETETDPGKRP